MRFSDTAILLSVTKYSESTAICRLFGKQYGMISGAVRGALSRKNSGIYQTGNVLALEWSARLAEHLGSLKCEMEQAIAAHCLQDKVRLSALNSILALIQQTMMEHDPHPQLWNVASELLGQLKRNEPEWKKSYCWFELILLQECGFRLDLDCCVVTGEVDDLCYVSPKSGGAVSALAGAPYKDKLLPLPDFIRSMGKGDGMQPEISVTEMSDSLRLTGYFLENSLFASLDKPLPAAREKLVEYLTK